MIYINIINDLYNINIYINTLENVLQNWLNWFHFLFLSRGLLVIMIDCMIFLSPFLDVTRMSMSAVSFFVRIRSK